MYIRVKGTSSTLWAKNSAASVSLIQNTVMRRSFKHVYASKYLLLKMLDGCCVGHTLQRLRAETHTHFFLDLAAQSY